MKCYKCDICSQYFDERKLIYMPNKLNTKLPSVLAHDYGRMMFDICPDCINAIQKTIDHRSSFKNCEDIDTYDWEI